MDKQKRGQDRGQPQTRVAQSRKRTQRTARLSQAHRSLRQHLSLTAPDSTCSLHRCQVPRHKGAAQAGSDRRSLLSVCRTDNRILRERCQIESKRRLGAPSAVSAVRFACCASLASSFVSGTCYTSIILSSREACFACLLGTCSALPPNHLLPSRAPLHPPSTSGTRTNTRLHLLRRLHPRPHPRSFDTRPRHVRAPLILAPAHARARNLSPRTAAA